MPGFSVDVVEYQPGSFAIVAKSQGDVVASHQDAEKFERFNSLKDARNSEVLARKLDCPVKLDDAGQDWRVVKMAFEIEEIVGQVDLKPCLTRIGLSGYKLRQNRSSLTGGK